MRMSNRLAAEFFGTFWLVFGGCGSAIYAAAFPEVGIGLMGVALAFGLTVVTMAYAVGHISGGHFNPAITLGLWAGRRIPTSDIIPYWIAQVVGAIAAAAALYLIATGKAGFGLEAGFAANGFGEHSPGGYSLTSAFVAEVLLTFFFLVVIMGATDKRAPAGFASARHRALPDADPPDLDPGDQHLGQSGALHRPGDLRRRLGPRPALAVLGGTPDRRRPRRPRLPLARRRRRQVDSGSRRSGAYSSDDWTGG